jgi:hypothetical protein
MSRHWLAGFALMALLCLVTPTLTADNGKGQVKENPHATKGPRDDDRRWEQRGEYEYRVYSNRNDHPPGWSKGKKTGWGNCGLPPGQAKKYGCQTYVYQGRPYYYYQDDQGQIIVRRPVIEVHSSIDVVH